MNTPTPFPIRITFSGLLLISILFFPFFISLIIAVAGMFFIKYYWEVLVLFFIFDLIYGIQGNTIFSFYFGSLLLAICLLLIIEFFKKKLRFYQK